MERYHTELYRSSLERLNQKIWEASELKFGEFRSAQAIMDFLEEEGFTVCRGIAGLDTAFVASYGSGSPTVAFLAEYDALDGLSQQAGVDEPAPRPETTSGHGCGHNLLAIGNISATLVVRDYLRDSGAPGSVRLYGCPGEEGGSGKVYMVREGCFQDVDFALTWHPCTVTAVVSGSNLANCQAYFRFFGKSAHAGFAPHLGRSALDASELMAVGVNYLREHMLPTDRIHYAVTDAGGLSPNVVQSRSESLYLIRSKTSAQAQELYQRVCDIAKGAALMTGTRLEIQLDKASSQLLPNAVLERQLDETMRRLGPPAFTPEEIADAGRYAKWVREEDFAGEYGVMLSKEPQKVIDAMRAHRCADFLLPYNSDGDVVVAGSSDVGDVSQVVPTAQIIAGCFTLGAPAHSWLWTAQGESGYAMRGALFAGEVLGQSAVRVMEDPDLLRQAKEDFRVRSEREPYRCPIPADHRPPCPAVPDWYIGAEGKES